MLTQSTGLDSTSFLSRLAPEALADLQHRGRHRWWPRGGVLCSQDESSRWVAVLLLGRVKISSLTDSGDEVVLSILGPGALIGELEAIDGKPRPATVSALEPVAALMIPYEDFVAFLRTHEVAARLLMKTLCERIRYAERTCVDHVAHDTAGRLAMRIVELAERYGEPVGGGVSISVALTQDELAGWINASREAVSKGLRALRARGFVETGRRTLLVRDLEALRRSIR
jgi:CRP-like cAMP-binding protein